MMQSIVNSTSTPSILYARAAEASVSNMYNDVPIVAGTDANTSPFVPANPLFGPSIHDELDLLVEADLSPAQAIQGATPLVAT